jgi:hypothetical protein
LVADIEGDRFGAEVLLVWEASRGSRRVGEWCTLLDLCEDKGIGIAVTTHGRIYDPRNGRDRRTLLEDATDSEYESYKISTRVRRNVKASARDGRAHGGRVYGYRRGRDFDTLRTTLVVDEHQAAIVRESARRLLEGWTLSGIARDLNERGERAAGGGRWGAASVRSMVTNNTVSGRRVHDGQVVAGEWDAIMDEDTWLAVRARLAAGQSVTGDRRRSGGGRVRHTYLLSGLLACVDCGRAMTGQLRSPGGRPATRRYVCATGSARDRRGCGQSIDAAAVEDYVTGVLVDRLDHLAARFGDDEHATRRDELSAALAEIEARRANFGAALADGEMDMTTYKAARERLARREHELQTDLAALPLPNAAPVDVDAIRASWDALTIEERQELLGMFASPGQITITRAEPGASRRGVNAAGRVQLPDTWA